GWTGRDATFRHMQGALQQVCKAFYDFGTVAMLTAGGLRGEVQDATRINVRFQLAQQASALRIVQTRRAEHVEGQLDLRGSAIDMLSPRTATAAELEMEFCQRYRHGLGNLEVGVGQHTCIPAYIFVPIYCNAGLISGARSGHQALVWLLILRCQTLLHGLD